MSTGDTKVPVASATVKAPAVTSGVPTQTETGNSEAKTTTTTQTVSFKKKKRKRKSRANRRTRAISTAKDGSSDDDTTVVQVAAKRKSTVNRFSTSNHRKKNAVNDLQEVSDRTTTAIKVSGGATAIAEFDTAPDRDGRAIRERNIDLNESGVVDDATVYRGQAGYKNYIKKDKAQIAANKFTGTQGPIRPSVFFRPSFRMDYQPDVCKDYKETGYCGYGTSAPLFFAFVLCVVHCDFCCVPR